MLSRTHIPSAARREDGFTLVETLVAMVTGVVVTGALFAILQFSVTQTSRLSGVAQATQISRGAMTHIVDELHSACLSTGFTPVQGSAEQKRASSMTKLIVANGYGEESELANPYTTKGGSTGTKTEGARLDRIEWSGETLTDYTTPAAGTEANGEYKWTGTESKARLAEKVTSEAWTNPVTKKVEPSIFRYYEYAPSSSLGTAEAAATLKEINLTSSTWLSEAQANKVAAVLVEFRTAPTTNEVKLTSSNAAGQSVTLSSQTTFAFSAPNSETTIEAGPCE